MNPVDENTLFRKIKRWLKSMPLAAIPIMFYRVLRGFGAYRRILRACPPEEGWQIYFMDYDGSGDTYLTCGYLQAKGLLDSHTAFAASGNLSLKIAKLFLFGRYTSVVPKAALTVRMMERFCGQNLKLLPLLYESDYLEYSGIFRLMAGHRGLDFMSMLKIGLEANCGVPYEEGPWIQPEFSYDSAEVDAIFRTHGLISGRTVLLAPYAGKHGLWGISMAFYAELAKKLWEKGFTVCSNSSDPQKEPPVPGTTPLLVPHRLVRAFCEKAGGFVGLRSGLCDIVSAAKGCRKIVLYGDMPVPSIVASHREFFSMGNMRLCEDAVELETVGRNEKKVLSQVIAQLLLE